MKESNALPPQRTLIFDFDGTLADTLPRIVSISNRLATEFGYRHVREEDIEALRGQRSRDVLRRLKVPLLKIPTLARRFKAELRKEIHLVKPILTVPMVVAQLQSHYLLGIVTSNSVANVRAFLAANNMDHFAFVRSATGLFSKSSVLNQVVREQGLAKAETLYIGDEVRDIEAARACGIDTIAVTWGGNNAEKLAQMNPRFIAYQPEELLTIVARW